MQSRIASAIEAVVSTAIGYAIALATQLAVLPLFGLHPSLGDNLAIAAIFTAVSLVRGYAVRRMFNSIGGAA